MKLVKYKIIIWILFAFFIVEAAKADVGMVSHINKNEFNQGDTIVIKITVKNSESSRFAGHLISGIEGGEVDYSFHEYIDMDPGEQESFDAYSIKIDENSKSGEYFVTFTLLDNDQNIVSVEKLSFSVTQTLKPLDIELDICKDLSCSEEAKIFIKNEEIFLDYSSDPNGLLLKTTLIYPDQTKKSVNLPTSIQSQQIGTFTLETTASKQGYKTTKVSKQFAVIEKEVEIVDESKCNANTICEQDYGENELTCPQDCVADKAPIVIKSRPEAPVTSKKSNHNFWIIITASLFFLCIIVLLIINRFKEK